MRISITLFTLLFLSLVAYAHSPSTRNAMGSYHGAEYVKNYDGDTITFNFPNWPDIIGFKMPVRVYGIDTPEIRGSKCQKEKTLAYQAKEFVKQILSNGKMISVLNIRRGKYFRIVGEVMVDGKNIAQMLIGRGLAVPYFGKTKTKNWCK